MRHYEDAERIITRLSTVPPLERYASPRALAEEMVAEKQIKPLPKGEHAAFVMHANPRGAAIRNAFEAIGPMYWGPRKTLDQCIETIQSWLREIG